MVMVFKLECWLMNSGKCVHSLDDYFADVCCLSEEFGEALKVGNLLGSLNLTVEGDVSIPLS